MLSPKSANSITSLAVSPTDQNIQLTSSNRDSNTCAGVNRNISARFNEIVLGEHKIHPSLNTRTYQHINPIPYMPETKGILKSIVNDCADNIAHMGKRYITKTLLDKPIFNDSIHISSNTSIDMNTLSSRNNDKGTFSLANSNAHIEMQQYCLRWNNFHSNLTRTFSELFLTQSFVDVTIICSKSKSLKAHKLVLSACSPYFYELFMKNDCDHVLIIINDVEFNELTKIIEFMYKGEINILQEEIEPLLKVAQLLKVRGLADLDCDERCCENYEENLGTESEFKSKSWSTTHRCLEHIKIQDEARIEKKCDIDKNKIGSTDKVKDDDNTTEKSTDILNIVNYQLDDEKSNVDSATPRKRRKSNGDVNITNINLSKISNDLVKLSESEMHSKLGSDSDLNVSEEIINSMTPPPLIRTLLNNSPSLMMDNSPPILGGSILLGDAKLPGDLLGCDRLVGNTDDLEIKPGIAEMIREEERAKLLENSQAWLGASTSSISDSYQYQLQSLWQKCWNTNQQSLLQNLRFRERGPLKSWRPETMAEAIFSVLKQGLSLSQAARKYDIPYPTFVLYANRVHNMLGPSADGGSDLRPKGRGRPQRILLGVWPDEHIRGVIRTVVFRDAINSTDRNFQANDRYLNVNDKASLINEESPEYEVDHSRLKTRHLDNSCKIEDDVIVYAENMHGYPSGNEVGPQGRHLNPALYDGLLNYASDQKMNAATVAAISHNLRQQMSNMVSIAQQQQFISESPLHPSSLMLRAGVCTPESPSVPAFTMTPSEAENSSSSVAHDLSASHASYKFCDKSTPAITLDTSTARNEQFPEDLSEIMHTQGSDALPDVEPLDLKDSKSLK